MGMTGVWLAYVLTELIVLVMAVAIYILFRKRTKKKLLEEAKADDTPEEVTFEN